MFDVNAACSGFVNALQLANYTAQADPKALILVIASEIMTRKVDWTDRNTCVLFGDGAGAVLVSKKLPANPKGFMAEIKDIMIQSDGSLADLLTIYGGGSKLNYKVGDKVGPDYFLQMAGSEVFKNAVRSMAEASQEILERNNLSVDDVNLIIPHQANNRIIEAVGNRLNVSSEKLFSTWPTMEIPLLPLCPWPWPTRVKKTSFPKAAPFYLPLLGVDLSGQQLF